MTDKKTLGIIGGMGSVATVDVFQLVVQMQSSITDQEYVEVFVHNNVRVPDRTAGILGQGPSALSELQRSVEICNQAGADVLIFACMTSHHYIPELQIGSRAEIVDGVAETVSHVTRTLPDVKKAGILASTGNIRCGLFQRALEAAGLEAVLFDDDEQQHYFTDPIYEPWGIKAGHVTGRPRERFQAAAARLQELGADAVIGGCSEVQTVLSQDDLPVPLVNSMDCLCRAALTRCGVELS